MEILKVAWHFPRFIEEDINEKLITESHQGEAQRTNLFF